GLLLLLAVEHLVDQVGAPALFPEDVAGMSGLFVGATGGVAVEDRTAEGDVGFRVAVRTDGHVPAGHYELKFPAAGRAEDRDTLSLAPRLAAGVVLELFEKARIPLRVDDAPENIMHDDLLFFGKEVAADMRLGDLPVVGHVRP